MLGLSVVTSVVIPAPGGVLPRPVGVGGGARGAQVGVGQVVEAVEAGHIGSEAHPATRLTLEAQMTGGMRS